MHGVVGGRELPTLPTAPPAFFLFFGERREAAQRAETLLSRRARLRLSLSLNLRNRRRACGQGGQPAPSRRHDMRRPSRRGLSKRLWARRAPRDCSIENALARLVHRRVTVHRQAATRAEDSAKRDFERDLLERD